MFGDNRSKCFLGAQLWLCAFFIVQNILRRIDNMYCEKCGAKINEVDNYCHQCGYHFQRLNQKMTYDTKPKKLDNKSMIKAVVVLCLAIAVGFIILFCVNYSKKHSPDYLFVNSWYRESTGKRIEFLSTADSKISYTKDVDNELADAEQKLLFCSSINFDIHDIALSQEDEYQKYKKKIKEIKL